MQKDKIFFKKRRKKGCACAIPNESMQNSHIKDFPNHLPYLVIFRNDNKRIDDEDHLQNNTPFIEVYICQVGFEPELQSDALPTELLTGTIEYECKT